MKKILLILFSVALISSCSSSSDGDGLENEALKIQLALQQKVEQYLTTKGYTHEDYKRISSPKDIEFQKSEFYLSNKNYWDRNEEEKKEFMTNTYRDLNYVVTFTANMKKTLDGKDAPLVEKKMITLHNSAKDVVHMEEWGSRK